MIQHRVIVVEPNGMVTSKAFNDRGKTPGAYIDIALQEALAPYYGRPKEEHPTTLTIHYSIEDL